MAHFLNHFEKTSALKVIERVWWQPSLQSDYPMNYSVLVKNISQKPRLVSELICAISIRSSARLQNQITSNLG